MTNEDLLAIFEEKVQQKGYSYLRCKSDSLKTRMEELYRPIFQQKELPKDGFIYKGFAQAMVLEVLHLTCIN